MVLNKYHKEQSKRAMEAISKQPPMSLEQFTKQFHRILGSTLIPINLYNGQQERLDTLKCVKF